MCVMPRPAEPGSAYLPGLDGVRAIAVAAVLAYHLNPDALPGGLLGVGVFFTLSGFLITSVLLRAWEKTQRRGFDLKNFYLRRARRLLPAVVLVLLVVGIALLISAPFTGMPIATLLMQLGQSLAALFYVANWYTIASGQSYFERFQSGPMDHLWSLSVEEQFYLIWPLLLLGMLWLWKGKTIPVAVMTGILAIGSFALMWFLFTPGFDQTRLYEGTDTRAGGLLVGAVVALAWHGRERGRLFWADRVGLDAAALAGLVVMGLLFAFTDQYSAFLYQGGILLLSLATVVVVFVAAHPFTWTSRVLGITPLRWIGERSYGIYLWHLPLFVFAPEVFVADQPWVRPLVLTTATVVLAALSWTFLEDPIRRHGFLAYVQWDRRQAVAVPPRTVRPAVWLPGLLALTLVTAGSLTAIAVMRGNNQSAAASVPGGANSAPGGAQPGDMPPVPTDTAEPSASDSATPGVPEGPTKLRTNCTSVAYIGDSTSVGLTSGYYIPKKKDRLPAQFKQVGTKKLVTDIRGARSIVERYNNEPNAHEAEESILANGFVGCWTFALGNNEAANQYVGGSVPLDKRIDIMMAPTNGEPVLWLTTRTLRTSGPYSNTVIQRWNTALRQACQRYPNMRIYDWASEVKDSWFIGDRIHFTSRGWRERAHRIAQAMAAAFPEGEPPSEPCVVRSTR